MAPPRRRRDSALLSDTFETDAIDQGDDFLGKLLKDSEARRCRDERERETRRVPVPGATRYSDREA
jgi:hypothetical protein